MRIAVMGAGGVGGSLGGLLARAGNEVTLIARGAHLEAIRQNGLRLKSPVDEFTVRVDASDDPSEVGLVELVLFTVKTYQNAAAIPVLTSLVGEGTAVLTLQNGVESGDELANVFGWDHILPGALYATAHIESPGVITQQRPTTRLVFGEVDGQESQRGLRFQESFANAGIEADLSKNVTKELWTKFLSLGPGAGITSASRTRIKQLLQYPESRATYLAAMREVEAVALAKGVNFDPDIVENRVQLTDNLPDIQMSMHVDIEMRRPLELEALVGAVVRIGRQEGVSTPIHNFLCSVLLPHKEGAEGPR